MTLDLTYMTLYFSATKAWPSLLRGRAAALTFTDFEGAWGV
jgi:hypothetical protein